MNDFNPLIITDKGVSEAEEEVFYKESKEAIGDEEPEWKT
jgi:hypothetical protein